MLARLRAAEPASWLPVLERLAGDPLRPGRPGAPGQRGVHRGRSPVLHRPGGRAEHALCWTGPRTTGTGGRSAARSARRRCGTGWPASSPPRRTGWSPGSARPARPSCGAAWPGRWPPWWWPGCSASQPTPPEVILAWYDAIVAAVSELAGAPGAEPACGRPAAAFGQLAERLRAVIATDDPDQSLLAAAAQHVGRSGALSTDEAVSNAAVLMFGGIETTEGMITNAAWHLLNHPDQLRLVRDDPELLPSADRGVAPAGASRRRGGPLRHPGRGCSATRSVAPGGRPGHRVTGPRLPRPGGVPRPGPVRGSAGRTRTGIWPSPAARTSAWACTWPGWKAHAALGALLPAARAAARPGWRCHPDRPGVPQAGQPHGDVADQSSGCSQPLSTAATGLLGARDSTRCRIGPPPFVEKVEGGRRGRPAKEET